MLSDHEIEKLRAQGAIIIEPFRPEALNPNSYDLTLGPYVARYRRIPPVEMVKGWRDDACEVDLREVTGADLFRIVDHRDDGAFKINAGESVLCHTNEFVGGTGVWNPVLQSVENIAVNTQLRATSTAGRLGLTACRCAGHGDAGYFDRWTLEVQNNSPYDLVLPVGGVICQLVFFAVATPRRLYQEASGSYQQHRDLDKLMQEWTPRKMLPKKLKSVAPAFWKGMYE